MSERILVRGEISWWVHVGRGVGALVLIVGIGLIAGGIPAGYFVAPAGALVWLTLEMLAWQARRQRTYLIEHADGFELEDRTGRRTIRDAEVTAASLETKRNLRNGEYHSLTRTYRLWTDERSEPVLMQNTILAGKPDPLANLINRLFDSLSARFEEALNRGGYVVGDGWQLSRSGLTVGTPPSETQLAFSEITAVEAFDGKMCVWQRGQDEACARLPLSGRNAYLLPALVTPRLPERADTGGAESASGLGRVLFQRQPSRSGVVVMLVLGLAGLLVGGIGGVVALGAGGGEGVWMFLFVPIGLGLLLLGLDMRFRSFKCHERGVWQSSLWGQKMLRYADIATFLYSATRHYHNGAYTGTHLHMKFKPLSAEAGSPISFSTTVQGDDDELDELRNFISRAIAARMAQQLAAGQPVRWTPNLEFYPEGIRYRPAGMFGRKDFETLPFERYGGQNLQQGVFYLFAAGASKAVATEECSTENFFPGYFLLLQLLHSSPQEEEAAT